MISDEIGLREGPSRAMGFVGQPLLWLGLTLVLAVALLSLPLSIAIGPMYWDTYLYVDVAQRIAMGQIPSVDFSTPVGPMVYYLFAWGLDFFQNAQLLLLAQWCILVVAAPLMVVVVEEVSRQSRSLGFALLVPFLVFALAPANALPYSPFPGLDGFGIYNRHGVLLLYVLVSGLLFLKPGRKLVWFCAITMLALFLTKITAFLSGGLLGLLALAAGRLSIPRILLAAVIFAVPLCIAEALTGFVSAYLADIAALVGLNQGLLVPRVFRVVSSKLDVIVPAGLIAAMLFWLSVSGQDRSIRFFDRSYWWLGVGILAGIAFETQNTGSQEFIFLWPILVMIWTRIQHLHKRAQVVFLALAAFCAVPTVSTVAYKALRSVAVLPTYEALNLPILKNMQQVATRSDYLDKAKQMTSHYVEFSKTYESLARLGHLPSVQHYSELDFQMFYLMNVADAAQAILDFEATRGIRLNSLMTMEFTDPFPWLLDRQPTRHIPIAGDPSRTMEALSPEGKIAIEATDGILRSKCPITWAHLGIEAVYSEALAHREIVAIHPCWDLLLRRGIGGN
jgi:hypothetical protein